MPTGVYIRSASQRLAMSISNKGKEPWNKGIKMNLSAEQIEAKRKSMKGNKHSLGIVRDATFRRKISEAQIGTHRSKETKEKLKKQKLGSKNPNWRGGINTDKKHIQERKRVRAHRRRAKLNKVEGSFTAQEWRELKRHYGYCCPRCGRKEPIIKLTIDHIVPINKGGNNFITNIQPLCGTCNSSKADRESEAICKQLYL